MRPRYIPDELVGACAAIRSCFRPAEARGSSVAHAASSAASFFPPQSETTEPLTSTGKQRRHEADLDFVARLSWFVEALCFVLPPLLVFGLPMMLGDASQTPQSALAAVRRMFSAGSGKPWLQWLVAVVLWFAKALISTIFAVTLRFQLLERQYARLKRSPAELADKDSRFASACGLSVHYKAMTPGETASVPQNAVALLHGFGANTWSWAEVQQQLADDSNALVTAHCMPGFGLTERSHDAQAYTLRNNGDIGREIQAREIADSGSDASAAASKKRVLVGHSLGCAGIASSFVEDPEAVDGIVLVAPAIMANPFERVDLQSRSVSKRGYVNYGDGTCREAQGVQCLQEQYAPRRSSKDSAIGETAPSAGPFAAARKRCLAFLRPIWFHAVLPVGFFLLRPVIIIAARILVRRKPFWVRGLRQAHFQPDTVSDEIVYRYRLPSLVRGWESGLLQFVKARMVRAAPERARSTAQLENRKAAVLTEAAADSPTHRVEQGLGSSDSSADSSAQAQRGDTLLQRFERELRRRRVPVLIVHGEQDTLVPISNSSRLSAVLQAPLVKLADCGHTPAEEVPAVFVEVVKAFVQELHESGEAMLSHEDAV